MKCIKHLGSVLTAMPLLCCVDVFSFCFDKDSTILSFIRKTDHLFLPGICWPREIGNNVPFLHFCPFDHCLTAAVVSTLSYFGYFIVLFLLTQAVLLRPASSHLQSPLTMLKWNRTQWKQLPVCLLSCWYHQLCIHILPPTEILPSWHKLVLI